MYWWNSFKRKNCTHISTKNEPPKLHTLLRHKANFLLCNGLLYKRSEEGLQFVLPRNFQLQANHACHDDIGHLGCEQSLSLLKDHFYWPNMNEEVTKYMQNCRRCLWFKAKPQRASLNPINVTHPLEVIHVHYLTIESGKGDKDINFLVVTDHCTCYSQACITPSCTAGVVAKTLLEKNFFHCRLPEKNLTDQGQNFESNLIKELCHLAKVKTLCTTPYRPKTNGQCE